MPICHILLKECLPSKKNRSSLFDVICLYLLAKEAYVEYDLIFNKLEKLSNGKHIGLLVWGIILSSFTQDDVEALIILLFLTFFPGLLMIIFFVMHFIKYNEERDKTVKRYYELNNELYNHYLRYSNCTVGAEYSNPAFLCFLLEKIYSGRADTIKEALNIVVNDSKYRILSEKLSEIQRNTSVAATNAGMAAIFSAANLMK